MAASVRPAFVPVRAALTSYGEADILRELEYDLQFCDIRKDRLSNGLRR